MGENVEFSLMDIERRSYEELPTYAALVREHLIEHFSKNGGHVGSNLGIVELLLSVLKEFDYTRDYVIFDTGHQSYLMKLFTPRPKEFASIRKLGGLSGFMDKHENRFDRYISGHGGAGFSTAVALSQALERDDGAGTKNVVCVIGDAALAEGVALEALNNIRVAGGARLIVVLNDNGYSIEQNVGNINGLLRDPALAERFFTLFGLEYVYCEDGHDLAALASAWAHVKRSRANCVLHARTRKGHGLPVAEGDVARKMHYTEPFFPDTGARRTPVSGTIRYVDVNSITLAELREEGKDIVVVTQAMRGGNGLDEFHARFPESFVDVGMCEQHALSSANGISIAGKIPIIALHSAFLPRAFDQIFQDICLQNIHAVILVARSGLAGPDGPTHHGVFDMSYLRCLPNLQMIGPKSGEEYFAAIRHAVMQARGPIVVLTPHANTTFSLNDARATVVDEPLDCMQRGHDVLIVATGPLIDDAKRLIQHITANGYSCGLVHLRWIKPLAVDVLKDHMQHYAFIVVLEENTVIGGIGSEIAKLSAEDKTMPPVRLFGVNDCFLPHGDIPGLRRLAGLAPEDIFAQLPLWTREPRGRAPASGANV